MVRLENLLYWDLIRWGFKPRQELAEGMSYYWLERRPLPGNRRPPVVFLHGIGANLAHWHDVALYFRWWGAGRCYLLDLPGHGRSTLPSGRLTPDKLQRLVESWADRTIGEEPVVWVGNSLGGSVALRCAIDRPKRTAGVATLSPAVGIENEAQLDELRRVFEIRTRAEASAFLDRLIPRLPWYLGLFRPHLVSTVLRVMRERGVRDLIEHASVEDFRAGEALPGLKAPLLAVWGGRDRVLPGSMREWLRARWPEHGQWWAPEAAGHCPQIDWPRPTAARLWEFVSAIRA